MASAEQKRLLKSILGHRIIAYHPALARIMGSATGGIWLSQILYWDNHKDSDWFYKSNREIIGETGLTEREGKAGKNTATNLGIVESETKGMPRISYYRVNYDKLAELVLSIIPEATNKLDTGDQLAETLVSNKLVQSPSSISGETTHYITHNNNDNKDTIIDKETGEVISIWKAYEDNIAILTPIVFEALKDWLTLVGPDWIYRAIKEAAKAGVRNLRYIESILKRWRADGHPSTKIEKKESKVDDPDKYIKGRFGSRVRRS